MIGSQATLSEARETLPVIVSEYADKVASVKAVLAESIVFDRAVMERSFGQLSGLDMTKLEPKVHKKLDYALRRYNQVAESYPEVEVPGKPLPALALEALDSILDDIMYHSDRN